MLHFHFLPKYVLLSRFEVNETIRSLTLVAYRNKGTYGNVSLFFYAQNLEAQQGLDYNASEMVSIEFIKHNITDPHTHILKCQSYNNLCSMAIQKEVKICWVCFRFALDRRHFTSPSKG